MTTAADGHEAADLKALQALLGRNGPSWLFEHAAALCGEEGLTRRLKGDREGAAPWDRASMVGEAVQTALAQPPAAPGAGLVKVLATVKNIVDSSVSDFETGVEDGTYDSDEANLSKLADHQAAAESLGRLVPALSALYGTSKAVIDAMGGWPPDFLKEEASSLEDALIAVDACAVVNPEPIPAGPRP
ncbi:hypothetical protein ACVIGB_000933 [Bradyrhizobium sp. USDA 4341]